MITPISPPQDLSEAIAHCEAQLKRLHLHKSSPAIVLWLEMSGYAGEWSRLEYDGFANLYRFLKKCSPDPARTFTQPPQI